MERAAHRMQIARPPRAGAEAGLAVIDRLLPGEAGDVGDTVVLQVDPGQIIEAAQRFHSGDPVVLRAQEIQTGQGGDRVEAGQLQALEEEDRTGVERAGVVIDGAHHDTSAAHRYCVAGFIVRTRGGLGQGLHEGRGRAVEAEEIGGAAVDRPGVVEWRPDHDLLARERHGETEVITAAGSRARVGQDGGRARAGQDGRGPADKAVVQHVEIGQPVIGPGAVVEGNAHQKPVAGGRQRIAKVIGRFGRRIPDLTDKTARPPVELVDRAGVDGADVIRVRAAIHFPIRDRDGKAELIRPRAEALWFRKGIAESAGPRGEEQDRAGIRRERPIAVGGTDRHVVPFDRHRQAEEFPRLRRRVEEALQQLSGPGAKEICLPRVGQRARVAVGSAHQHFVAEDRHRVTELIRDRRGQPGVGDGEGAQEQAAPGVEDVDGPRRDCDPTTT